MNCHYCPTLAAVHKYHRTPLCKDCFTEQMLQIYTEWENISHKKAINKIQELLLLERQSPVRCQHDNTTYIYYKQKHARYQKPEKTSAYINTMTT